MEYGEMEKELLGLMGLVKSLRERVAKLEEDSKLDDKKLKDMEKRIKDLEEASERDLCRVEELEDKMETLWDWAHDLHK